MWNSKKIVLASLLLLIGFPLLSHADTYVDSYYRSDSDGSPYNNYGFPGNLNPNTGKITQGNADTYLSNYYGIGSVGGQSNAGLYKLLNSGGLKQALNIVPLPDSSEKLFKAQVDFQAKLEQEHKVIQDRLYQLQLKNSTGVFAQCVYPSAIGCSSEDQYSKMRALDSSSGLLGTDISNNRLNQCRSQIDSYQTALTKYNQCINDTQNKAMDSIADKAVEIAKLEKESAYYQSLIAQKQKESADLHTMVQQILQKQSSCQGSHGPLATYNSDTNRCECRDGMAPDTDNPYQCIPLIVWCKIESGIGATNKVDVYADRVNKDVTCKCDIGYQWDDSKDQCLAVAPADDPSPATKFEGSFDPSKLGATPVKQPKKTLKLSEFTAKKPKVDFVAATSTNQPTLTESPSTTRAQIEASSMSPKPSQKQTVIEKLRTFFSRWWRW